MEGGVGHQGPQNGIAEELQALVGELHGPTLGGGRMSDGREQVLSVLEGAAHNLLGALELGLLFCGEAHRASRGGGLPLLLGTNGRGSRRGRGGHALGDDLRHMGAHRGGGHGDAVLHGRLVGGAVPHDDGAFDTEQRRAAVGVRRHLLLERAERALHEQRPHFGKRRGHERGLQVPHERLGRALDGLQADIAGEPVGDHHVEVARHEVAPLAVSREGGDGLGQKTVGLLGRTGLPWCPPRRCSEDRPSGLPPP